MKGVVFLEAEMASNDLDQEKEFGILSRFGGSLPRFLAMLGMALLVFFALPASAQIAVRGATSNSDTGTSPSYVASTTATITTGTSITINKPTGTVSGHVMLAQITVSNIFTAGTVTAPTGWTLIDMRSTGGGANITQIVYWKLAGASEPTSYTWSWGTWYTGIIGMGGILTFQDVDSVNPIHNWNAQPTDNSATITIPALSTTRDNVALVALMGSGRGVTHSTPTGMTERYDTRSGSGPTNVTISSATDTTTASGVQAARTSTLSSGTADNVGHIIGLNAGVTALTLSVPSGTAVGDFMLAYVFLRPCSMSSGASCISTLTAPAGWTLLSGTPVDNLTSGGTEGYGSRMYIYQRVASASEPASYSWTLGGSAVITDVVGGIVGFSGVDTSNPIIAQAGNSTASSTSHMAPSLNNTVANAWLVTSHGINSSNTWTPPAGMTERVDKATRTNGDSLGLSLEVNTELRSATGATGTRTAVDVGPADGGSAYSLLLRPASVSQAAANFNCLETSIATYTANDNTGANALYTKLAATNFSFDVVALKSTGAVETAYIGASGAAKSVTVELVDNSDSSVACASKPVLSPTVSQAVSFAAGNTTGRTTTGNFNVTKAYPALACRVTDTTSGSTVTGCSSDSFSVRPSYFVVSSSDATGNTSTSTTKKKAGENFNLNAAAVRTDGTTAVTGYTGTPKIQATQVLGTNTAGTLSGTFNPGASGTGIAAGSSFTYSEVGIFGLNANAIYDDTFTNIDTAVNPVTGLPQADCISGSSSTTLTGGKYGCQIGSMAVPITSGSSGFGRFIPDHFAVSGITFTNRYGMSCSTTPVFSYMGEPMRAQFTLTAQNAANGTTTNYQGSYAKLDPSLAASYDLRALDSYSTAPSLNTATISAISKASPGVVTTIAAHGFSTNDVVYIANVGGMTELNAGFYKITVLNATQFSLPVPTTTYTTYTSGGTATKPLSSGGTDRSARLTVTNPTGAAWASGVAKIGSASPITLQFTFNRSSTGSPDGGYQAQFGIAPVDSDGVKLLSHDMDVDSPYGSSSLDHTALGYSTLRYGRARLTNVHGSELLPLSMPLVLEYYNGSYFAANALDNCTTFLQSDLGFNVSGGATLASCNTAVTAVTGPSPNFTLTLAAPGTGKTGWTDLTLNLGASGTGTQCTATGAAGGTATTKPYTWLQYNWTGTVGNPTARATFGKFRSGPIIYLKEVY